MAGLSGLPARFLRCLSASASGERASAPAAGSPAAGMKKIHLSLAPHSAQYSEPNGTEVPHEGQADIPADVPAWGPVL